MFTENTYGMMCNCVDCEHDYDFWYETYLKNADDSEEAVEDHWYIEKGCDDLPEIAARLCSPHLHTRPESRAGRGHTRVRPDAPYRHRPEAAQALQLLAAKRQPPKAVLHVRRRAAGLGF